MNQLVKFSIISFFLLGFPVLAGAQSDSATYLYHICSNRTAFTPNSTYQSNLNLLFTALTSNASRPIGFYSVSTGRDPDDVYGSILCRGDIAADACKSCATFASQDIAKRCPIEKVAIVWYDQCLLRYGNQSFFSRNDQSPAVYMWNTQNVSGTDPARFNTLLASDMRAASTAAAGAPSGAKKFAVREANISAFQTLYSLVQCTPDLSASDCSLCLQAAISQLPNCCDGKQGGRVLSPSCNIRYEIYSFYNSTALEPPPPPPSPPPPPILPPPPRSPEGKGGISTGVIVAIVVSIVVSIVLFCFGCCFLKRRAKKEV